MAEANRSVDEKEYFSRVNLALTDCGRRVLSQLLQRRVGQLTPENHPAQPWSLDDFLNHYMEDILLSIGKEKSKKLILYPGFGIKTDLAKWDIPLFVFVLLNASKLDDDDNLHRQLRHDICNLRELRNKMLHKGTPVLDESMYHNYLGRIVGAVQRICDYMQEPDLKISLLKEINKYESLRHIYTNGLISELGCKTVEIINEADAAVESGLQQMKTILQKKGLSVNIPVLDVIVMFRNYNKEDEQSITDRLLETFTEALKQGKEMADDQTADKLYVEVKALVRKLFDEKKEITKVSRGCIILSIQCHDLDAVISLVQDSLSGKLGSLFEPLEEVIWTDAVHALFEVCVGITGQSCWALLNEMFCEVSDECEKRLFTVKSTVHDDGIGVRIQRFLQSFTDKENLEKSFFSKEKKEIFMKIQEDLTIDLDQPGMKMVLSYPKNNEGAETEEPNVLLAKENEDGNGEHKRQNADTEMSNMSSKAFASSSGKPQSDTSKTESDRFGMEFTDILQPQNKRMDVSPSMNDQTTFFKATQSRTINQSQTNDALIAQYLRSKTTNEPECEKDKLPVFSELLQTEDDINSPNEEDDEEEIKWSIGKYVDDRISPFYKLPSSTRLAKDEKHTTANTKTQADALKESVHDTKEYEEKYTRDRSFWETVFSEEMFEINIESDQDDIGRNFDDEDIHLRGYQEELAQKGCQGENVIVMAPANSGKTRVACRIMQVHLRQKKAERKRGCILFLVENEALAIQQGEVCAELLPSYRTKVFSGNVHRLKKQMLWNFLERGDIFVVTAQILLNALRAKKIESVTEFSLIIFDECHHSYKQHMHNEIMSRYLDLKLRKMFHSSQLPQIVGLTASLGVGGKTDWVQGLNHMKKTMANMDAKHICTVKNPEAIEELKLYVNPPVEEILPVQGREVDSFKNAVDQIAKCIDAHMFQTVGKGSQADEFIQMKSRLPATFGTEKYLQWNAEFVKNIAKVKSKEIHRVINPCRLHLEAYNTALMIHRDARISDALVNLEEFMENFRVVPAEHPTDALLMSLYDDLRTQSFHTESENSKLLKLEKILTRVLCNDQNARGIIFVRTQELAQAMVRWVNESDSLNVLNASGFVGQSASASVGGMTKFGQKDVLQFFKDGYHRLLIATSVAEEGLDISKCNLVIRYEHVTNEIVRLQSRGRARAENSLYYVIAEKGSWILEKEEKNRQCEELMNQIVRHLQVFIEDHFSIWEKELLDIQGKIKQVEQRDAEEREMYMAATGARFECVNCSSFICLSDDIRVIKGTHYVIIDEEAKRCVTFKKGGPIFTEPEGAQYGGTLYCANEECQRELGSVCTYKNFEFPLIGLKNFRVVDRFGNGRAFKKWKQVNCRIEELTFDELEDVVVERLANM